MLADMACVCSAAHSKQHSPARAVSSKRVECKPRIARPQSSVVPESSLYSNHWTAGNFMRKLWHLQWLISMTGSFASTPAAPPLPRHKHGHPDGASKAHRAASRWRVQYGQTGPAVTAAVRAVETDAWQDRGAGTSPPRPPSARRAARLGASRASHGGLFPTAAADAALSVLQLADSCAVVQPRGAAVRRRAQPERRRRRQEALAQPPRVGMPRHLWQLCMRGQQCTWRMIVHAGRL